MDQHAAKRERSLRPTSSLPSTAEAYGEKHGLPPDLQRALESVGRRGRQSIAQPSFSRHATTPTLPSSFLAGGGSTGFRTNQQIIQDAQGIINKDTMRSAARELRPYGSSELDSAAEGGLGQGQGQSSGRRLVFGSDGSVQLQDKHTSDAHHQGRLTKDALDLVSGTKRTADEEEEGTEVDEEEGVPSLIASTDISSAPANDFPPVFNTSALSHPELFASPQPTPQGDELAATATATARFAVPALPARAVKALPGRGGRTLGKTVSAPVGRLGAWGSNAMDVDGDGDGEDGFDISEWAGSEDF